MPKQETDDLAPFDPGLNQVVIHIASRLVPEFAVADTVPATYEELKRHLDAGNKLLVAREGSGKTIFGAPEVNYAFRAWHDWCHWKGEFDFSLSGECATCSLQISQLRKFFGVDDRTAQWARLLVAEVVGQRQYYEKYRTYIADQRAFTRAYMEDRSVALGQRW